MSSPLAYPPTSSPPPCESPRKRRKLDAAHSREPLGQIVNESTSAPRPFCSFLAEADSDDEEAVLQSWTSANKTPDEITTLDVDLITERREQAASIQNAKPQNGSEKAFSESQDSGICMDLPSTLPRTVCTVRDCSGKTRLVTTRTKQNAKSYEQVIAERSVTQTGRATTSYYGIQVHRLVDEAKRQIEAQKVITAAESVMETVEPEITVRPKKTLLWTEKYRARKFTDLVGDERTHRSVLRWLKGWDQIVFPGQAKPQIKSNQFDNHNEDRPHRKLLLLTGPPGLGKTTLAHVCAKQAGYEVQEINASDDRSASVVKGQIRDMLGTENVRPVDSSVDGKSTRAARPVCVIVDEVDGVVTGSGPSSEGGFIKALTDLLALDQRNSNLPPASQMQSQRRKRADRFRMMRPMILVCNDVYHPSLRLLRQGSMAEIIHIRKAPLQMVAPRLQAIFTKEGVPCDADGVRALCEATWGVTNRKEDRSQNGGTGDGDMRSILVTGEWVAGKLRAAQLAANDGSIRMSKKWLMQNVLGELAHGGQAARSLGRGGSKEVAERVFLHNAGFVAATVQNVPQRSKLKIPGAAKADTANESGKFKAMDRLSEMIAASGESDRILSDVWTAYPTHAYQDDTILSKPARAYDWLHFHSLCSDRVHASQEWELASYLSYPILAFHQLFAGNSRHKPKDTFMSAEDEAAKELAHPLTTTRAAYFASEALKSNKSILSGLHGSLSLPIQRHFRGIDELAVELVPHVLRILNPDVKPVVVGGSERGVASVRKGSEREVVDRSVQAMVATGVKFEKTRLDFATDAGNLVGNERSAQSAGFVYRMEPPLDDLGTFGTASKGLEGAGVRVRYAVRQVLEQEHRKELANVDRSARQRRANAGLGSADDSFTQRTAADLEAAARQAQDDAAALAKAKADKLIKRDFFGRPVVVSPLDEAADATKTKTGSRPRSASVRTGNASGPDAGRIWVTYHEGYSKAVRKPITLAELLGGL